MGPTIGARSSVIVKQLLNLPVLDRVKAVKELMVSRLDAIHSQVLAVHSIANALLANDSPLLQSSISLIEALQQTRHQIDVQHEQMLEVLQQAQGEVQRHGQTALDTMREAHEGIRQQGQLLREGVQQARDDIERHGQTLLGAMREAHEEVRQQGRFLQESLQQAREDIERQGRALLYTVRGAHDDFPQRLLELETPPHGAIPSPEDRGPEAAGARQADPRPPGPSLMETVQQMRAEVARHGQTLLDTVQGAHDETREQILEVGKHLQDLASVQEALRASSIPPGKARVVGGQGSLAPEIGLMAYLYSYLPNRTAVDVGANVGKVARGLLDAGYEVYAFEPYPPVFQALSERLGAEPGFHGFPVALGPADDTRPLYVASDTSATNLYGDPTLYSSLIRHAMPEDLAFTDAVPVTVRSLESVHASGDIPASVGLVKIDTEGFDLAVIRGMGAHQYDVVVAEYWDPGIPFAATGAMNRLHELVAEMRRRGYHWNVIFHTTWGDEAVGFYCNYSHSLARAWGNVFFFRDHQLFTHALVWCTAVLPGTYVCE